MSSVSGFSLQLQPPSPILSVWLWLTAGVLLWPACLPIARLPLLPAPCSVLFKHTHDHSLFCQSHYRFPPAFCPFPCSPSHFLSPSLSFLQPRCLAPVSSVSLRIFFSFLFCASLPSNLSPKSPFPEADSIFSTCP